MNESVKKIQEMLSSTTAALIFSQANRFYLSGFETDAGVILITKNDAVFFTDFRYLEAAKRASAIRVLDSKNLYGQINETLKVGGIAEILTETDFVNIDKFFTLKQNLNAEISNSGIISKKLTDMRSVKSEREIALIKEAQKLTDETFNYILPRIEAGRTEKEIMLDMEFFMRKNGSEGVAFDFIVVSGKNTSLPHGVPTEKRIEKGDFVTMDFGGVICGYRSDMTRTVAVGSASDEQKAVYNTVLKAQLAAIEKIKAGAVCCDIDKIARDIIEKEYSGTFGHGLGHSVGIEIHESPAFNTRDTSFLQENTVITVEPGIYLENKFGVRIEDMVIVTKDGCENITKSDKKLIVL